MSAPRKVSLCGRQLEEPGHICAFFDSREEEYDVLAPFYSEGISLDEEIISVVGADRYEDHCRRLEAHGIDVAKETEDGKLHVLTADDWYMKGGPFGATRMYELVQGALADLQRKGRRARGSGVMDWALNGGAEPNELMVYESRVNFLVPTYECTLLCVYDVNELNEEMMSNLLETHPFVIEGRQLRENPRYVPPVEWLRKSLLADTLRPEDSSSRIDRSS